MRFTLPKVGTWSPSGLSQLQSSTTEANDNEPFVFPAQVQHVFYFEELNQPWWKVVLHKEPRSRRVVIEGGEEQTVIQKNGIKICKQEAILITLVSWMTSPINLILHPVTFKQNHWD
jgi:hypothetical protein